MDTTARVPKSEDEICDFIVHRLRKDITGHGVIVNREVQVRRIAKSGIGERSDIRLEAHARTDSETSPLIVPIEAKLAWNGDVDTAMDQQLLQKYMVPSDARHGIYLVYWFDPDEHWADNGHKRAAAKLDRADLTERLGQQARSIADRAGVRIEVVILDASWRID